MQYSMLRRCFAAMDMLLIVVRGVSFRPPQYDSGGALGSMVGASELLRATALVVLADLAGRCMRACVDTIPGALFVRAADVRNFSEEIRSAPERKCAAKPARLRCVCTLTVHEARHNSVQKVARARRAWYHCTDYYGLDGAILKLRCFDPQLVLPVPSGRMSSSHEPRR